MPKKTNTKSDGKPSDEKAKETATSSGNKKKILIVEDERPLAHALELKFAHEGFDPKIATNGEEGLEMSKKEKYAIILLDLIMPGVDGFAFLEDAKKRKLKTPILVLTNLGQDEDQKRATDLGAKGYFVKSNTPIAEIVKQVKSKM